MLIVMATALFSLVTESQCIHPLVQDRRRYHPHSHPKLLHHSSFSLFKPLARDLPSIDSLVQQQYRALLKHAVLAALVKACHSAVLILNSDETPHPLSCFVPTGTVLIMNTGPVLPELEPLTPEKSAERSVSH